MPVEIRELIIRATATPTGESSAASCNATTGDDAADDNQDELVEACVRQVLKILERKKER
uniref:Uncharacterized protein n=1 Tax=Candidatus Kentrum sp. SD TaxID=2126332 RepID=A0A451BHQ4_9GAMM|nr:MAG: hypothetical protein BECKSD772F_GA0070984_100227 [Candidatus Kentron sp. SD]VFK39168.1 MAG: hypothetical protein BECKSD772E_GA0070983_100227 [Candidatus Kentron sp. SD]VFK77812.1 MAG: hypothetical protein BECKSD772D_GA0070982_100226 [Candidatus Kentron sp. SD]